MATNGGSSIGPVELVDRCLDEIGMMSVSDETRASLVNYASADGEIIAGPEVDPETEQRVSQLLQIIAATHEFQRA